MEKKKFDPEAFFDEEYEEDAEEYGYEDYEEYIEDDIYGDHDDFDGVDEYGGIDDVDGFALSKTEVDIAALSSTDVKASETEAKDLAPAKETNAEKAEELPEVEFSKEPPKGDGVTKLDIPKPVMEIIDILKEHTYTSYLVGDCVYMMVLGERVMDFDIACNASLDRIIAIFFDRFKVREDSLSRGELILINGAMGISVAPYRSRIDGSGKPIYCKTIDEDLHRRTFTSETVAYNPDSGIYDPFKGLSCITAERTLLQAIDEEKYEKLEFENAKIKKKGNDEKQRVVIEALRENPETILIAMQKYARAEADISPYTLRNINNNASLLDLMTPSEITRYFKRILLGRRITDTLLNFKGVIFHLFPQLKAQDNFDQKSEYQEYTMYEHTAKAVGYAFPDYAVRLALLLHGIGKPDCAADRGEYMSFYGHAERGVMLARDVFEDYEADQGVIDRVLFMILHHDDHVTPENAMDYVDYCGMEYTRLLLLMQSANVRAKSSDAVNERVSGTLRQLADHVTTLANVPKNVTRRTATLDELKGITELMGRNGI